MRRASFAVCLTLLAGCGSSGESSASTVVAAFYPLAYAAERIAPAADVENLTPAGAEPHDLELSPRDVQRVHDAATVLYLGHGFMPALEGAVAGRDGAVDLLAGVPLRDADPHVWLAPRRYAGMVRRIARALGDPAAGDALVRELDELDADYRRGLARCERRELVTSHAAFGYLADAYGLEQVPLTGLAPEAEPSAREIEALVDRVRERGATTVFFEPLVSSRLAETVAREAGVGTALLNPLEGLSNEQAERGEDYFTVMRSNLAALRKALGCR